MEPVTAACHRLPSVIVIKVFAELDLVTADALREHCEDACAPGDEVILDLTETTFMDCSGIRALLRVREHVSSRGGTVRLCGPQSGPAKIIAITRIDECLPVHETLEEALRSGLAGAGVPNPVVFSAPATGRWPAEGVRAADRDRAGDAPCPPTPRPSRRGVRGPSSS